MTLRAAAHYEERGSGEPLVPRRHCHAVLARFARSLRTMGEFGMVREGVALIR